MAKQRALDIFNLLSNISTKRREHFDALTEQELKEMQPYVVMRWLTGTFDAQQIYFINELVNPFVFELRDKRLLYYLLTIAAAGKNQRYKWIKPASRKGTGLSTTMLVIKKTYNYTTKQATEVLPILTNEQIMQHAEDLGLQKEEIAQLRKELKTRNGKV
jgi:hypothetical protein